jgi:two-component system chemotaxis response regulator CheB
LTKILVVDDAAFMRMKATRLLTKNSYEVVEASTGAEAGSCFKRESPDAVLLDITMPDMDGLTALKEIKSVNPDARVAMVTAMGQQSIVMEALKAGASDFVVKPFSPERVLSLWPSQMALSNAQNNSKPGGADAPVRVLVVGDSAFARSIISRRLSTAPGIEIVGEAKDGLDAFDQVKAIRPDVVTMDVTMPRMDGLAAVKLIMADRPTPIVMLSALTGPGADVTMQALELGAIYFFLKPSIASPAGSEEGIAEPAEKIRVAAGAKVSLGRSSIARRPVPAKAPGSTTGPGGDFDTLVIIGSSTGGPKALAQVVPDLPGDLNAAVLIVQHMPPQFTALLSARLNNASELEVVEAKPGDRLKRGRVLMAPGGYHMTVKRDGSVALNKDPEVHGVRPSVDVTMQSAVKNFRGQTHAVILTGMGSDGRDGCREIKAKGGRVITEHESTCAVYGMPKAVVDAGLADRSIPLEQIGREIARTCGVLSPVGA